MKSKASQDEEDKIPDTEGKSPKQKETDALDGDSAPNDGEGVTVSEDFQKQCHGLLCDASKHEVKHLREKTYDREQELRDEEMKSKKKEKGGDKANAVVKFTSDDMPSDLGY